MKGGIWTICLVFSILSPQNSSSIVWASSRGIGYSNSLRVNFCSLPQLLLKSYVDIQKYRFGDDFNVLYDLDELLFEVSIIKFVLQPIFENAISHGRLHTVENGTIKLTLRNYEDGVEFKISDNGVGMSEEKLNDLREQLISDTESESKDGGIGLKNVYRRIKLYYKGKGSMEVNSTEGKGTEVVLRLPFI